MKNKLIVAGVIFTCLVLLVGCGDEKWNPLDVEIVDHETGCLALEEESITPSLGGRRYRSYHYFLHVCSLLSNTVHFCSREGG